MTYDEERECYAKTDSIYWCGKKLNGSVKKIKNFRDHCHDSARFIN